MLSDRVLCECFLDHLIEMKKKKWWSSSWFWLIVLFFLFWDDLISLFEGLQTHLSWDVWVYVLMPFLIPVLLVILWISWIFAKKYMWYSSSTHSSYAAHTPEKIDVVSPSATTISWVSSPSGQDSSYLPKENHNDHWIAYNPFSLDWK